MKKTQLGLLVLLLLSAACSRQPTQSDGNGPGNADGAGGRADPPSAPAWERGSPRDVPGDGSPTEDSVSEPNPTAPDPK